MNDSAQQRRGNDGTQPNQTGANRVGDFLDLQRPLQPSDRDPLNPANNDRTDARDRGERREPGSPAVDANGNANDRANADQANRDQGLRDARMLDERGEPKLGDDALGRERNRDERRPGDVNDRPNGRDRDNSTNSESTDRDRDSVSGDRPDNMRDGIDRRDRDGDRDNQSGSDRDRRDWRDDRRSEQQARIDINRFNRNRANFNQRPRWANNNYQQLANVNRLLLNQSTQLNAYNYNNNRINYWNNWASPVRGYWLSNLLGVNYFTPNWFNNHPYNWGAYSYGYAYNSRPWYYWWNAPRYNQFSNWFSWGPSVTWTQPIYYDYGPGGNVYYQDSMVYVNSQPLVSADEYAQSAALLATVEAPSDLEAVQNEEWLPLGTFALVANREKVEPQQLVQLAVNRDGVVSGTMFNQENDQAFAIQGRVDKDTQRVAFRVDNQDDRVYEAGLYNLTQSEAPVLVHFGTERSEQQVLVRLEAPETDSTQSDQAESLPSPATATPAAEQ